MIGCGRGSFELTGSRRRRSSASRRAGARTAASRTARIHIATVLEWGVRRSGSPRCAAASATVAASRRPTSSRPTTTTAACCSCSTRPAERSARRCDDRSSQRLRPRARRGLCSCRWRSRRHPGWSSAKKTQLGLDLKGGIELIFQARPRLRRRSTSKRSATRSTSCARASISSASPSRKSSARAKRDQRQPAGLSGTPSAPKKRSARRPAVLLRLGEERDRAQAASRRPDRSERHRRLRTPGLADVGICRVRGGAARRQAPAAISATTTTTRFPGCTPELNAPRPTTAANDECVVRPVVSARPEHQAVAAGPATTQAELEAKTSPKQAATDAEAGARQAGHACVRSQATKTTPGKVIDAQPDFLRAQGRPGAHRQGHHEPAATTSTNGNGRRSSASASRATAASIFQKVTATIAERGQNNLAAGRHAQQLSSTSRSCSTTQLITVAVDRLQPVPERDRLGQRLGDHRRLHVRHRDEPRERARSGALPIKLELISTLAGLGDARPPGAQPGPDRAASSASLSSRCSCSSSTACSA